MEGSLKPQPTHETVRKKQADTGRKDPRWICRGTLVRGFKERRQGQGVLTQDAALHAAVIQQPGPWPPCHRLAQGPREQPFTSDLPAHTQGLAQPGRRKVRCRGSWDGGGPQHPRHLPVHEPHHRALIMGTNHLYHIAQAAPERAASGEMSWAPVPCGPRQPGPGWHLVRLAWSVSTSSYSSPCWASARRSVWVASSWAPSLAGSSSTKGGPGGRR